MNSAGVNRFADLYKEGKYLTLKNHLYNYLLRKRAIKKCLKQEDLELILEVGSGISPAVTNFKSIVYSDLSLEAVKILRQTQASGYYVVADGMQLPFKSCRFSHIICSEVLEHLKNDRLAIKEMSRTLRPSPGCLIITVPHRKRYFTNDDIFVKHYRRYEMSEIKNRLKAGGLQPVLVQKVLGPLEKITMSLAVFIFTVIQKQKPGKKSAAEAWDFRGMTILEPVFKWANLFYKGYAWLDAMIMPRCLATVILIKSVSSKKEC